MSTALDTRQRIFTVDQLIAGWDFEKEVVLGHQFSDYQPNWWVVDLVEPKGGWQKEHATWVADVIEGRGEIGQVTLLAKPAAGGGTVYTEDGWKLWALLEYCRELGGGTFVELAERGIVFYPSLGLERRTLLGTRGFEVVTP